MKIKLTHDSTIDGVDYPAKTKLEVSEEKGRYLVLIHRAEEVKENILTQVKNQVAAKNKKRGK